MKLIRRSLITLFIVIVVDVIVGRLVVMALTTGGLYNPDTTWVLLIVRGIALWCGIKWGWNSPRLAPKKIKLSSLLTGNNLNSNGNSVIRATV